MKKALFKFLGFAALISSAPAFAAHTRVTNPNALGLEVLGRGLLYSISFDRVISDDFSAGIGFGTMGANFSDGTSSGLTTAMIPAFVNYYFAEDQSSVFATGGVTVITNAGNLNGLNSSIGGLQFSSVPVVPNLGVGYENRSDAGFLFRVAGYVMYAKNFLPWGGLSIGYSF